MSDSIKLYPLGALGLNYQSHLLHKDVVVGEDGFIYQKAKSGQFEKKTDIKKKPEWSAIKLAIQKIQNEQKSNVDQNVGKPKLNQQTESLKPLPNTNFQVESSSNSVPTENTEATQSDKPRTIEGNDSDHDQEQHDSVQPTTQSLFQDSQENTQALNISSTSALIPNFVQSFSNFGQTAPFGFQSLTPDIPAIATDAPFTHYGLRQTIMPRFYRTSNLPSVEDKGNEQGFDNQSPMIREKILKIHDLKNKEESVRPHLKIDKSTYGDFLKEAVDVFDSEIDSEEWFDQISYKGFNKFEILKTATYYFGKKSLIKLAGLGALRGKNYDKISTVRIEMSDGSVFTIHELEQMRILWRNAQGSSEKLTLVRITQAFPEGALLFLHAMKDKLYPRIDCTLPAWCQFPGLAGIKLNETGMKDFISFARPFSELIGGVFRRNLVDAAQRNSVSIKNHPSFLKITADYGGFG